MKYLSFSIACLLQAFAFSTTANAQLNFPYTQNERILYYGIPLDTSISQKLSTAYTYTDHRGLASVKQSGEALFGYLDTEGQWAIEPAFEKATFFSEGLAFVQRKGKEETECIDTNGNVKFSHTLLSEVSIFQEGLAAAAMSLPGEMRFGYIDTAGQFAIPASFEEARNFHEGMACVKDKNNGKWGLINQKGEYVIPAQFDKLYDCYRGIMVFTQGATKGLIDTAGNILLEDRYKELYNALEGYYFYQTAGDESGYMDTAGNTWSLEKDKLMVGLFSHGLVGVYKDNLCGYADRTGKIVIKPAYSMAGIFTAEGQAICIPSFSISGGRMIIIDTLGTVITTIENAQPLHYEELFTSGKYDMVMGLSDFYPAPSGLRGLSTTTMKEDIKKTITMMCVSVEAQLAYEKSPGNASLKEAWDKAQEAMEIFGKKMSEKYKDEKPDKALIKWAEEEVKKCKAVDELKDLMARRAEREVIMEAPRTGPGR